MSQPGAPCSACAELPARAALSLLPWEPSGGGLSQVIPPCLSSATSCLIVRIKKKGGGKSVKPFLCVPQVSHPGYSALQSPPFVVQQCLLRWPFGSLEGDDSSSKLCLKKIYNITSWEWTQKPHLLHRSCGVVLLQWDRWNSDWEDPLCSCNRAEEKCRCHWHMSSGVWDPLALMLPLWKLGSLQSPSR